MKKVTLFVGMLAMAAFLSTSVLAQDKATTKTADPKTTTTTNPSKADTKPAASCDKKEATKDCKPGCTMHKDKCCDKDKKAAPTATPDKK